MNLPKLSLYTLICCLLLGTVSCESPLKDFNLVISNDVIRHTAVLEVLDTEGAAISNVAIKLLSGDTQDIYNLNGYKQFQLTSNLVTFGLDPKRNTSAASPVSFKVEISAPGYYTQVVPVAIADISTGIQPIRLIKESSLPDGITVKTENISLAPNGSVAAATVVTVEDADSWMETVITIPAGTQLFDANGNIITGSVLAVTVITFDPTDPASTGLLPGGSTRAEGVVGPNGETMVGTFSLAGSSIVRMTLDGKEVKGFSIPIQVQINLDPEFRDENGTVISAGKLVSVYSFSDEDPTVRFETVTPVLGSAQAGYRVLFTVDHLTTFLVGTFLESCAPVTTLFFNADWIDQGFTYPLTVQAIYNGQVIASAQFSVSEANKSIGIAYLPATGVQIVVRDQDDEIVAQAPLAACGTNTTINLPDPNPEPKVTLQLYVRCPGQTSIITVLPTFQLYYREANTGSFEYLGEVTNGFLQTALLKSDGTKYDFRAIWNERTKTVNGKAVLADNSGTVGTEPGDIIGEKAGATNLGMLVEECGKL